MKIIAMTIQSPRTSPKLIAPNIQLLKDTLFKRATFPESLTALTLFSKVTQSTIKYRSFQPNHLKANNAKISEDLFNSSSNMHVSFRLRVHHIQKTVQ